MKKFLFLFVLLPVLGFSQNLTQAEYFFDTDPGYGNGIKLTFNPKTSITMSANLYTGTLEPGFHTFFYRFKDDENGWGNTFSKNVFINKPKHEVQQAEYFFDTDPGYGNGIKLNFADADEITMSANLYTGLISTGYHTLYYRFKSDDTWGTTFSQNIYKPYRSKLERIFYAYDDFETLYTIALNEPVYNLSDNFSLNIEGLDDGEHTLHLWVQNSDGVLSDTVSVKFNEAPEGLQKSKYLGIKTYPNPASDYVLFNGDGPVIEVIICSMDGVELKRETGTISKISVSDLSEGIYFLILKTTNGVGFETLVVNR